MIPAWVAALVGVCTFLASVTVSAFVAGMRFSDMRSDIKSVQHDLAEIKGMFTLRLKD